MNSILRLVAAALTAATLTSGGTVPALAGEADTLNAAFTRDLDFRPSVDEYPRFYTATWK